MKRRSIYFGLLALLLIFSCSQRSDMSSRQMMAAEEMAMAAPKAEQAVHETTERKLIKEGRVEFETTDLDATRKSIFEAVSTYKGYVSSDEESNSPGRRYNTVVIRIPAENFDNLLRDATQGVKKFERKEITVKDVTEEFLDVQARLTTKKELEKRYIDLLSKAQKVTEILEIENQIGQLRADIESIEGRLNYLQSQVAFSTLTMSFYERLPTESELGPDFKSSFERGWNNLIWFFIGLISIWPFILIGIGLFIGVRAYRKRKKG